MTLFESIGVQCFEELGGSAQEAALEQAFALAVRSLRVGVLPTWEQWAAWSPREQTVMVEAMAALDAGEIVDPIAASRAEQARLQAAADELADRMAAELADAAR